MIKVLEVLADINDLNEVNINVHFDEEIPALLLAEVFESVRLAAMVHAFEKGKTYEQIFEENYQALHPLERHAKN